MTVPRPGDIYSNRLCERRARVLHVFDNGRVRLRTVTLIGSKWQYKEGGTTSTCAQTTFEKTYRLLVRGNA